MTDDYEIGRYGFRRIDRTELQSWAEAVSDDEALGINDKAFALELVGEYSDSTAENVTKEFREPMSEADSVRRVAISRLVDCGYARVTWTRDVGQSTVFGIVLGLEVWENDEGVEKNP